MLEDSFIHPLLFRKKKSYLIDLGPVPIFASSEGKVTSAVSGYAWNSLMPSLKSTLTPTRVLPHEFLLCAPFSFTVQEDSLGFLLPELLYHVGNDYLLSQGTISYFEMLTLKTVSGFESGINDGMKVDPL